MKFDTLSFLLGLVVAIIISLLFVKKSFYEGSLFTDAMTIEDAQKLMDNETETMKIQYQQKDQNGTATEEDKKKYQDDLIKLSTDFNTFMMKKSMETPAPSPAPSPAPETQAPAPAPETQAPVAPTMTPQTSTYEIEPYAG